MLPFRKELLVCDFSKSRNRDKEKARVAGKAMQNTSVRLQTAEGSIAQ